MSKDKLIANNKRSSTMISNRAKSIVEDFNKIHNNKYNYSLVEYNGRHNKVKVICKLHGIFKVRPSNHLKGNGCKECYLESKKSGWKLKSWIESANNSNKFDSFKLYIIKCYSNEEEFYKIGRTYRSLKSRIYPIPYKCEVLKVIEGKAEYIYNKELELHKINKENSYLPSIKFKGRFECYSKIIF